MAEPSITMHGNGMARRRTAMQWRSKAKRRPAEAKHITTQRRDGKAQQSSAKLSFSLQRPCNALTGKGEARSSNARRNIAMQRRCVAERGAAEAMQGGAMIRNGIAWPRPASQWSSSAE
jgi:hypothetical protein